MRVFLLVLVACSLSPLLSAQTPDAPDGATALVSRLDAALAAGDRAAAAATFSPTVPAGELALLLDRLVPGGTTRAVVRERDRAPKTGEPDGSAFRAVLDTFIERGAQAAIYTLALDIVRHPAPSGSSANATTWLFESPQLMSTVEGLYQLALNPETQFRVRQLVISAEDLELRVSRGTAFSIDTPEGTTGMVVLGQGEMRFAPRPAAERGQVRLFAGSETLVTPFTAVFFRVNPSDLQVHVSPGSLERMPVDPAEFTRARRVFDDEVGKSFNLDLREVSTASWSLVPAYGDFVAEIRTTRFQTLTYARSLGEPEDISLFDRRRRRNISTYPSTQRRATQGPSYNEDALADYDIIDYDIEAAFTPAREWINGRARVKLRVRNYALTTLTLRLHEALTIRSVVSEQHGRLLALRIKGQNSFLVSLPKVLARDDVITLRVTYEGRLPPQAPDREVWQQEPSDMPVVLPETRFVYSNRSYWYPQGSVTDFATAKLRLAVPAPFASVASGSPAATNPTVVKATRPGEPDMNVFEFVAGQPVRYLSWVITKLVPVSSTPLDVVAGREAVSTGDNGESVVALLPPGVHYEGLDLLVTANPRQVNRARAMGQSTAEILRFYAELLHDVPFPSFTLTVVDSDLPGGHSPAYFALLYQPLPMSRASWRNDPVHFDDFPNFFLAHEVAHQFWGQAVGWQSYHEQWISEGFAQYFAALYAEHQGSRAAFREILDRMRDSVLQNEAEGPISLGYRLGHIRGEGRVFRAIVYNKGALVLHMLRRLVGDRAFFDALARFYGQYRFTKAGTDDVRRVFEAVTGRSLEGFFERWVRSSTIPRVRWSWTTQAGTAPTPSTDAAPRTDGTSPAETAGAVLVRFEQVGSDEIFDIPVTVTLAYRDGSTDEVVVPIHEKTARAEIPIRGRLQSVDVNADHAAAARFDKQ